MSIQLLYLITFSGVLPRLPDYMMYLLNTLSHSISSGNPDGFYRQEDGLSSLHEKQGVHRE